MGYNRPVDCNLSVLLSRVDENERKFHCVKKENLIQVAKYVLSRSGQFDRAEYDKAIQVLAKYHLAHLASRRHSPEWIEEETLKPYVFRCMRCGLPITAKKSLKTGYGHDCRKKLALKGETLHG